MHDHDIFQESFDRNRTFPLYVSNRLNLASEYISSMPNTHLHYSHNGFKIVSEVAFIFHNMQIKHSHFRNSYRLNSLNGTNPGIPKVSKD